MKIGILTYHRAYNYGAYLQACSLCNRLNMEDDIDAEIIDFRMYKEINSYSVDRWRLRRKVRRFPLYLFRKKLYKAFDSSYDDGLMKRSVDSLVSDSIDDFIKFVKGKYDLIIAGSDEIWKTNGARGFPSPYWLPGDLGCRKFSYAASSRVDISDLSEDDKEKIRSLLVDFEYISVRDKYTIDELRFILPEKDIHLNSDPSFLYDYNVPKVSLYEFFSEKKIKLDYNKKIIVIMTENNDLSNVLVKSLKNKYNLVSVFEKRQGCRNVAELSPMEWMTVIKNADMVLTSFFHGTCFSIIFGTPFLAFATKSKSSKLDGLFDFEEVADRYIKDLDMLKEGSAIQTLIETKMCRFSNKEILSKSRNDFKLYLKGIRKS